MSDEQPPPEVSFEDLISDVHVSVGAKLANFMLARKERDTVVRENALRSLDWTEGACCIDALANAFEQCFRLLIQSVESHFGEHHDDPHPVDPDETWRHFVMKACAHAEVLQRKRRHEET